MPGRYSLRVTPWWREPLECLDDRSVDEIIAQKSAQIGYTESVVCNAIGWTIDCDPCAMIALFPRERSAKDFSAEKLVPMIEATPTLRDLVSVKSRERDNRQDFKKFPGGFLKLVGSNSPGNVKSTAARRIIVEEPDDAAADVRGQGDAIALLRERKKTFASLKMLIGGTPTIKGISTIESEILRSDQRRWFVPCHHCGESNPLAWDNVRWSKDPTRSHPVYGDALPETARYVCPDCGGEWSDHERVANARRGTWRATAQGSPRVRGYIINELASGFPGSNLPALVEKYLAAQHKASSGDAGDLIAFWNSTLGEPWEYQQDVPDGEALESRAEDYAEWTVPAGGLIVTAGVDVQHDRLAVVIKAWGRGEESWLVWWGELYGTTIDKADPIWSELDAHTLDRRFTHANGMELPLSALSIDSGDGNTADAVYHYARARRRRGVMACKGASTENAEIFRKPSERAIDITATHKAAKYGLRPYLVGVSRAKDLILGGDAGGRLQLTGRGPGRMHWPKGLRADYFSQLTSEVKAPSRVNRMRKAWQKKAGARNEALDCEILALHAARSLRSDIKTEAQWQAIESALMQPELFAPKIDDGAMVDPVTVVPTRPLRISPRSS